MECYFATIKLITMTRQAYGFDRPPMLVIIILAFFYYCQLR